MSTAERAAAEQAAAAADCVTGNGVASNRVASDGVASASDCVADAVGADESCAESANPGSPDLTWLLHRAAQHMRTAFDEAARAHGLTAARDWIVLSALSAGPRQTQLSLAHSIGLDKTTMTSLLDRLEARGLISRCLDRHDRRARIPELTETGRQVAAAVTCARDRVEADLLRTFTAAEQRQLRELLTRLAATADSEHGSCI